LRSGWLGEEVEELGDGSEGLILDDVGRAAGEEGDKKDAVVRREEDRSLSAERIERACTDWDVGRMLRG
jgi:hypothetical protein